MGFWGYKPYVPVAARRAKAAKALSRAVKAGAGHAGIAAYRGAIAKTFWGKAWCDNLEQYSDYANRLPRGRTYLRNGSVIDLQIGNGAVVAKVMGSSLYDTRVTVATVATDRWQAIGRDCSGSIDSMVELLQGKLSKPVMERICKPETGLFPSPGDIRFSCSCPDWAAMCKHVAAVLYGIGARLDQQPELLFRLRGVDARDLIAQAGTGLPASSRRATGARVLEDSALDDVFGLEMDAVAMPVPVPAPSRAKAVAGKAGLHKDPLGKVAAKTAGATAKVAVAKAPSGKVMAKAAGTTAPSGAKTRDARVAAKRKLSQARASPVRAAPGKDASGAGDTTRSRPAPKASNPKTTAMAPVKAPAGRLAKTSAKARKSV